MNLIGFIPLMLVLALIAYLVATRLKSKPRVKPFTEKDKSFVVESAQRTMDVVVESLDIAKSTNDPFTRMQRIHTAKTNANNLRNMMYQFPFLRSSALEGIDVEIRRLEDAYTAVTAKTLLDDAYDSSVLDGGLPWEQAEARKDDLEFMKKCCIAEIQAMEKVGMPPAPFYFERVAILSRKAKNYAQEVYCVEGYIRTVEDFYNNYALDYVADTRKGPTYRKLVDRLPKAKELLAKSSKQIK